MPCGGPGRPTSREGTLDLLRLSQRRRRNASCFLWWLAADRRLARQDEDGFLWIEGRAGSFLKIRGTRISLAEVEARVAAIPGVYECGACAVEHPEAGEALVLLIVPDQGARLVTEEIRHSLPAHWTLDSIRFVSELPKTSAGKIARPALSALGKELHGAA